MKTLSQVIFQSSIGLLFSLQMLWSQSSIKVSADGTGDYKTLQEAIASAPERSDERTTILLSSGTYRGNFIVPKEKTNLTIKGGDPKDVILTWERSVSDEKPEGAAPFNPGFWVRADGFRCENVTIENSAGDRGQALALEVDSDEAVFKNCRILGWQDTLFINDGRQFFEDCYIEGRVDFIFGSATAVFSNCEIHSKNGGYVTAASTPKERPFGFVFLKCRLTGSDEPWVDPSTGKPKSAPGRRTDLGRPWRGFASVAFINCELGDHITPHGWNNWGRPENESTARFAEFGSKTPEGEEIDLEQRVPWSKRLTEEEAAQYSISNILGEGWGLWDPSSSNGLSASTIRLSASAAHIDGNNAKLESGGHNIGYWSNLDTKIGWDTKLEKGKYRVGLRYALNAAYAGTEMQVTVGEKEFPFVPAATGGWEDYRLVQIGEVEINQPGAVQIEIMAVANPSRSILNVKEVVLQRQ